MSKRQNSGKPPNSTEVTGKPHKSSEDPNKHVNREVTDSEGKTTREHSRDPRDLKWGRTVSKAKRENRKRKK